MEWTGLLMLALVAVLLIATGLPAFMVLIGVATLFAVLGIVLGIFSSAILYALPNRIVGLLETDLLQALPLYVLMGVLLNRLPIASILFRAGDRGFARTGAAPQISAMSLGALLAPMNGSVGASVSTLSHVVRPRLVERGVAPEQGLATVIVASTLGVVIPPSLVLIFLGDAMMRAHTEAASKTSAAVRIINTQDVFRGSLTPAAIFFVLCLLISWAIAWRTGRRSRSTTAQAGRATLRAGEWLAAGVTVAFILVLLAGVTIGYFYAVEAAAMGAFALFVFGLASGALKPGMISGMLRDAMAVAGALFALLAAATTFTLVFRAFATDRLLDRLIADLPGGPTGTAIAVLLVLGLCAFVLDAFELIFVVVPVVMPALLTRVPDAVWVSVATLLVLQASFLIPPFGYAVMMARTMMGRVTGGLAAQSVPIGRLSKALAPYLAAQLVVLGLVVAFPGIAHFASPAGGNESTLKPVRSDDDTKKQFDSIMPNSGEEEPPPPPQFK